MIQDKTNIYKTKDIFEASYLYSEDLNIKHLEKNGNYYYFVFDSPEAYSLSKNYWDKTANGNIKKFVDSLKTLKDLIFSKKDSNGNY